MQLKNTKKCQKDYLSYFYFYKIKKKTFFIFQYFHRLRWKHHDQKYLHYRNFWQTISDCLYSQNYWIIHYIRLSEINHSVINSLNRYSGLRFPQWIPRETSLKGHNIRAEKTTHGSCRLTSDCDLNA